MKILTTIISIVLGWIFLSSFSTNKDTIKLYEVGETIEFDTIPYMYKDTCFIEAYNEIERMLEGKDSIDIKRAQFLVEWAYLEGKPSYEKYCNDIDSIVQILKGFIVVNGLQQYRTAGNFALFEYFTKPNPLNGNKPFRYDFEDFTGKKDFSKLFVSKVMRTHTGQCTSLPLYYKILSNELGAESFLAFAPNHMYIKHLDENNRWVNIELTNGHFATDAWMISSMDISAEAIKNRVYLEPLTPKQDIAFLLNQLSIAYSRKYGCDSFTLKCSDTAIKYFPQSMSALFMIFNTYLTFGQKYVEKYGRTFSSYIKNNYLKYKSIEELIENLGYREMSPENYEKWLISMEEEKEKQANESF